MSSTKGRRVHSSHDSCGLTQFDVSENALLDPYSIRFS